MKRSTKFTLAMLVATFALSANAQTPSASETDSLKGFVSQLIKSSYDQAANEIDQKLEQGLQSIASHIFDIDTTEKAVDANQVYLANVSVAKKLSKETDLSKGE